MKALIHQWPWRLPRGRLWAERVVLVGGLAAAGSVQAIEPASSTVLWRLTELSLEELGNIEITSVSKRGERLADAPASVYVITASQIRRSGATNLPEALRLAPNLQVARQSASTYSVTARGFAGISVNKMMLVLVDGRSVYSPLSSGVLWDVQDVMLEDIDRIEVISGPGGTLWGVNAVNGIINIITAEAGRTQGELVAVSAGNRDAEVSLRHGGALGEQASYRLYAKAFQRHATRTEAGVDIKDKQRNRQLGGRLDWQSGRDKLALVANAYEGWREQPLPGSIVISGVTIPLGPIPTSGANLVARWDRQLGDGQRWMVQGYLDHTRRTTTPTFGDVLNMADLQLQHGLQFGERHAFAWGAEVRRGRHDVTNTPYLAFLPAQLTQTWSALFAQDEISLPANLRLTLGARLEHNDYTGREWLPSARLAWKPAPDDLLWAAWSRTVRAPSRVDRDNFVPGQPPYRLAGGPDVQSEVAKVLELGYRGQPSKRLNLSATLFRAAYDDLRTQELTANRRAATFGNNMAGVLRGIELWGTWQVAPTWRLQASLNRLWQDLQVAPGSFDVNAPRNTESTSPARRSHLSAAWDLGPASELDVSVRYVSKLPFPLVPSYTALDLRWGWRLSPAAEFSLAVRNLDGGGHGEFTAVATRSELDRAVLAKLVLSF
ncbi:TonB-dependent receptor plug domain-containing protein [Aquabacterium sp.]|uniref:TonB-dependent receptor plug domain-containing protein n=1 Tax=Aquabacterium sp. TaxID=1872578 RepID=UPI002CA3D3DE|nr:TonB-dependent receptor [Aquabacterium sp.]HSW04498.1 TonB-dependent receptor [Aquabacterium sp.]